jgi:purine nucleosidase
MVEINRRRFVAGAGALAAGAATRGGGGPETAAAAASRPARGFVPPGGARYRVVIDNDLSGDPDGLFALVHHLLSPSVEIRAIVGSGLRAGDPFDPSDETATNAYRRALEVLRLMHLSGRVPAYAGSNQPLADTSTARDSAGARALVAEALRDDPRPLYVACGASLTTLASAYLLEPRIADRLTLVWIGGPEYPGTPAPPGSSGPEYNLRIDIAAAQVVFNESAIPIWQVPRNAYRQALVSMSELYSKVRGAGRIGAYLYDSILAIHELAAAAGLNLGETYIVGDSPLVLLTALQSSFQADPSSSFYEQRVAPGINDDGSYAFPATGRQIRVYTELDIRLMLDDCFAKLELHHGRGRSSRSQ